MTPPQTSAPLKLFYSYAREDEELRDELEKHLAVLKREGTISEWHDRAIYAGQEWDEEIKRRLNEADIILLLVSPDFLASDYIDAVEVKQAMERHEAGAARVIPIIFRECEWTHTTLAKLQALPKDAKPIKPRRNRDKAFNEVARGIRHAALELRSKPKPPPAAPPPKASGSAIIPRRPAVGFVSRRDEQGRDTLERLREELSPERGGLVALWGPGGSGKSTLAAEVARALRPAFNGRLAWVSALGRADFSLSTLLDEIATQLGSPELRTLALAPKEEQVRALVSASPALVVLDNFETISREEQAACAAFLAGCAQCPALITTRLIINRGDVTHVRLAAMESDEAREFLRRLVEHSGKPSAFARLDREELIRECEANPLVMQWVVSQVVLARRPHDVLGEIKDGEGHAAERVFDRSFNLPQLGDDGRAALLALSLFIPDASREALAATAGFGQDLRRLDGAVANLSSLGMVETTEGNERLLLRGLTRQLARSRLAKDERAADFRQRFVVHFRGYAEEHKQKSAADFDALELEKDNVLGALSLAFSGQAWPDVIRIRFALEEFLDLRAYWGEAVRTAEQALSAARDSKDEFAARMITLNKASIHYNRRELDEAYRLYTESLMISKRLNHLPGIALANWGLGNVALEYQQITEAKELFQVSLESLKQLDDKANVAGLLHQLALLAQRTGDFEQAQRLYEESLEINEGLGNEHHIAATLHQLGVLKQNAGEFADARRLYSKSLEINQRLGEQHGIALALNSLGVVAANEQDTAQAVRLFRAALGIFEKIGSPTAEIARQNLKEMEGEPS